jgi:hypothetical protein
MPARAAPRTTLEEMLPFGNALKYSRRPVQVVAKLNPI